MADKIKIKEVIVVEGRDDTAAVLRAVDAVTIETHGYGISAGTWKKLEHAYNTRGLIVLTDPDHAGGKIRKAVTDRFPLAAQAFLRREKATKKGDVGIENADPEDILDALMKAHATQAEARQEFEMSDLITAGLAGGEGSKERRDIVGEILGVGYCNSKILLKRLNDLGIEREDFEKAVCSAVERQA